MSGLLKPTLEIVSLSVPISFESRESYGDLRVRLKLKSANFLSERERERRERELERETFLILLLNQKQKLFFLFPVFSSDDVTLFGTFLRLSCYFAAVIMKVRLPHARVIILPLVSSPNYGTWVFFMTVALFFTNILCSGQMFK